MRVASGIHKVIKYGFFRLIYLLIKQLIIVRKYKQSKLRIGLNTEFNCVTLGYKVFVGDNTVLNNVNIGDYSYVNSNSNIRNTTIGKFCSIGPQVKIVVGNHPTNLVSTHPTFYSNNKPFLTFSDKMYFEEYKNVKIGNDVWIGEDVLIPGGIIIGDGAIVTSKAVVTKNVEPYSIVGGVPAKHIKYRFEQEQIKIIQESEWWNWEEDKLIKLKHLFLNPSEFILSVSKNSI